MKKTELNFVRKIFFNRIIKVLIHSFCILLSVSYSNSAFSQDVHFSSFDANPLFLNPANTGFTNNNFRIGSMYRNQWSTVSRGYNSYILSLESSPYYNRTRKEGLGIGINLLSDVAGSLSYGQRTIGISSAYYKSLSNKKDHFLSFGLVGSFSKWGFDFDKSVFGKYPDNYEGVLINDINTFDIGLGLHWNYKINKLNTLEGGFAVFHINKPKFSYYEDSDIIIPIKMNIYFSNLIDLGGDYSIKPSLLFQKQNQYNELIIGGDWGINYSQTIFEHKILSLGLYYRVVDAFIAMLKYRHNDISIGFSYDINLSKLSPASKTYGGVELWIIYSFNTYNYKQNSSTIPCPQF